VLQLSGNPFIRFLTELKRRRVPQTALWYIGTSVALVEAANVFLPSMGAPEGIVRVLAIAAVFGLPVALALAWMFDVSAADGTGGQPGRRLWAIVMVAGVSIVSMAGAYAVWERNAGPADAESDPATSSTADPTHIAVLGFNALGDDEELAAFANHLQARLIDGLSAASAGRSTGAERLRVVSHASILPFSHGLVRLDSIRDALDVGTVLEGTVEAVSGAVRVRVRLVDTQTGDQLAMRVAEARANDRVALLDAVADSVVRMIRMELGPLMRERMLLLETRNREAFDRVMWATQRLDAVTSAYGRKDYSRAERELSDADSLLAEAERLDPKWIEPILARAGMTEKRVMLARAVGAGNAEAVIDAAIEAAFADGIRHTDRALAIKPDDPRALEKRGYLRRVRMQVPPLPKSADAARLADAAERDLRASVMGNPTPAMALRMLSELAGDAGRLEEALEYGQRAYDEDPYLEQVQPTMFRLYEYSFALGRDAEAAKWCGEGRKRFANPIFDDCRLSLAAWSDTYPLTPDSAWAVVASELAPYPAPLRPLLEPRLHAMVAAVLVRHGQADSALTLLHRARSSDGTPGVIRASAGVYGLLGWPDSALAAVRKLITLDERPAFNRSPELRSLHSDARFHALMGPADRRFNE
jgi:TolB-like protein/tetratricopeptide (TPR) repeat protein